MKIEHVEGSYSITELKVAGTVYLFSGDPMNAWVLSEDGVVHCAPRFLVEELVAIGEVLMDKIRGDEATAIKESMPKEYLHPNGDTNHQNIQGMDYEFSADPPGFFKKQRVLVQHLIELKAAGFTAEDMVELVKAGLL